MHKALFLDLESTIITPVGDGWHNFELINIPKIQDVISEFQPDEISIFSFAIHNFHERDLFNKITRPWIERSLDCYLLRVPTVEEIIQKCKNTMGMNGVVSFMDMLDFWSKNFSFQLFAKSLGKDVEVLLLDDIVFNQDFSWQDENIHGKIRNIDSLTIKL